MIERIVEDNEGHLLGWVLFIVDVEFLNSDVLNEFVACAALVDEGSLLKKLTILVEDVLLHEVSELELSKDLRFLEVVGLSELVLGYAVKNVLEGLLVLSADQLINESALALVTPQANHEEAWILVSTHVLALVDDLLVTLSDTGHTAEDSCELTNSEDVVELSGGGEKLGSGGLPKGNSGLDQVRDHADDLIAVLLLGKKLSQDATVDTLDGLRRRRGNVDGEEQSLDTVGHIIATVGWVVHSGEELKTGDHLRVTSLFLVQEVEAAEVDELTSDFEGDLILPLVNLRH